MHSNIKQSWTRGGSAHHLPSPVSAPGCPVQGSDKSSDSVKSLPGRPVPPLDAVRLQPFPFFLGEFQFPGVCLNSLTAKRRKTNVSL